MLAVAFVSGRGSSTTSPLAGLNKNWIMEIIFVHKDWKAVNNIVELASQLTANAGTCGDSAFHSDVEDVIQRAIEINSEGNILVEREFFNKVVYAVYALDLAQSLLEKSSHHKTILETYNAAAKLKGK